MILTPRSSLPLDVEKGKEPPPSLSEGEGVGGDDKYRKGEGVLVESEDT